MTPPITFVQVDLNALRHNLSLLRAGLGQNCLITAGVKANAFSHGLVSTAQAMLNAGADWLFVNDLDEAKALRGAGLDTPILIASQVPRGRLHELMQMRDVRVFVVSEEQANELETAWRAGPQRQPLPIHLMVDTGMHREGVWYEQALPLARRLSDSEAFRLEGLCTHFATADCPDQQAFLKLQCERFKDLSRQLHAEGIVVMFRHTACSAAAYLHEFTHFNMVRPAASLYGIQPYPSCGLDLKNTFQLYTHIVELKELERGETVGYGCTFTASRRMKIALLPLGYYEGVWRALGNRGQVYLDGQAASILGRVSMHMTVVDVSNLDCELGTQVCVIRDPHEWAELLKTNPHEVMLKVPPHIPRFYEG